jgi:hypothetical protein
MRSTIFWDITPCSLLEVNMKQLATCFTLVSCMTYSSTLKTGVTCSSKTSVDLQWTTQHYIPEDRILHKIAWEYNGCNTRTLIKITALETYGLPGFAVHHSCQVSMSIKIIELGLILTHSVIRKRTIQFLKENKRKYNLSYSQGNTLLL